MRLLIGGAFGHLGFEILKQAVKAHDVIALSRKEKHHLENENYTFSSCDVTDKNNVDGICKDVDIVISTIGLTSASKTTTHYHVDLEGNKNLLKDAIKHKVKKFIYVSVIKCEQDPSIPMLHAKFLFEEELKKSGISYFILRPTGYFHDIHKVFSKMLENNVIRLPKDGSIQANVIDPKELARYILSNLDKENEMVEIGGAEVYSYDDYAKMYFKYSQKDEHIKRVPTWMFDMLALVAKVTKNGKYANIKFSKWTLNNSMVAKVKYGDSSFKAYLKEQLKK